MVNTTGFIDGVATYLASIDTSLTKGTNLFVMDVLDNPDKIPSGHVVIFDEGYEQVAGLRHPHYNWDLIFATSRDTRRAALDAAHLIIDLLLGKRPIITSGSSRFYVKTFRTLNPGVIVSEKLESGLYLAEANVQVQVIPD